MTDEAKLRIGVLALQGAFREHVSMLNKVRGVEAVEVRREEELRGLAGLVLPGGESTTMASIAERWNLIDPLCAWVRDGKPIWGTCAGLILLSNRVSGQKKEGQRLIGGLDVFTHRNYFGSQLHSFECDLQVAAGVLEDSSVADSSATAHGVFIRAPAVLEVDTDVQTLATICAAPGPSAGLPSAEERAVAVAVRQGNTLGTAFHPELTGDLRWHRLFVAIARGAQGQR